MARSGKLPSFSRAMSRTGRVTAELLPAIERVDPVELAERERAVTEGGTPGLLCGMCGIQPAVLGLAALRAMGASHGSGLSAATSADAGGPASRTVGYLAAAFTTDGRVPSTEARRVDDG
ncbi:MAG TPA: AmmeMemoRadiSam system protein B [Candidatus Limnocylindrales bacterium]